jgi:hypothetical protein
MTIPSAFAIGAKFWTTPIPSAIGWLATAVTAGSYLSRQVVMLKKIQAAAACLWIIYGVSSGSTPLIVANLIVAAMAVYSSFAERPTWKQQWSARLNRHSSQLLMGRVAEKSPSGDPHTAMVVSMYPPGGVKERTSDLVMFRRSACDTVPPPKSIDR